jgi:hypothetical protein
MRRAPGFASFGLVAPQGALVNCARARRLSGSCGRRQSRPDIAPGPCFAAERPDDSPWGAANQNFALSSVGVLDFDSVASPKPTRWRGVKDGRAV